jgi:hypothetical protein
MKDSIPLQDNIDESLPTNKFQIFLEIVVVFAPLYLSLIISESIGSDHVTLGRNIVLLGGPLTFLGLIISLLLFWGAARRRGASWSDFGVTRPKSWLRTVLKSLGVALVVFASVKLVISPITDALVSMGFEPRDMSRFGYLTGSLPNLIINLVIMWITAAFLEELMWRGYLMNRLVDLQGRQTKLAWAIALVVSAAIFGLAHFIQGPIGVFWTGAIGLVFGLSYLAVGRNLWPVILAHGLIDTLDFISHYFGG